MDESATRTLWCGNLSSEVVDEILFDLFIQAGPLAKVSIPKERDGRSKGYGFITFKHEISVPYAMNLMRGVTLFGRPINLQNRTGAKVDNSSSDPRNQYHQRSASLQEPVEQYSGSVPNMDLESFNSLLGMAGLLSGNPLRQGLIPQISQDMMPRQHNWNHQRSRSHNEGDRYYDRNSRDERRDYNNSRDRQRTRDSDYRDRPRNNGYHERSRSNSFRDHRDNRDRDRNTSGHRPFGNRYRSRD